MHNYHGAHNSLPYACASASPANYSGTPSLSAKGGVWTTMILPYIEMSGLYGQIDFNKHVQELPTSVVTTVIPMYVCPSDPSANHPVMSDRYSYCNPPVAMALWYAGSMGPTQPDQCSYCSKLTPSPINYCCQGNDWGELAGNGYGAGNSVGMFGRYHNPISFDMVTDGLSNTLLLGETLPEQCTFFSAFAVNFNIATTEIPLNTMETDATAPGTSWWRTSGFKSLHAGGANFAMADGSITFLSETIDYKLYNNLGTRAGGEMVQVPSVAHRRGSGLRTSSQVTTMAALTPK